MSELVNLWEEPKAERIYMIAGWRQWADAGAISSGLPHYLIQRTNAHKIGEIQPDGFYLFQIPGTHDLVRPVVKFVDGYPQSLETQRNEIYYTELGQTGIVICLGDEPHLDIERYIRAFIEVAQRLNVKRIIGLGGVYGEVPYNRERVISSNYSLPALKPELDELALNFSDYHGGASIGSVMCRRAGEAEMEYVGLYGFAPTYDFSSFAQSTNAIRIENDYMAWLGIMRRINYMLKINVDLADLEKKSKRLIETVELKIEELESMAPQLGIREYIERLSDEFEETTFNPLGDVWKDELRRLFDDSDSTDSGS